MFYATTDLGNLGRELRQVDKKMATAVRRNVRAAVASSGAEVTAAAKANASWSTRIPGATGLRVSFGARSWGITMRTNKGRAPHARPLEMGSKGASGQYNRHPVFGKSTRVNQPTRPFFFPAVDALTPKMMRRMEAAINDAIREAGFRGV